jgi:hypothetical protein
VRKARGLEAHLGGQLIEPGDDQDTCITSWLSGTTDSMACSGDSSDPVPTPTERAVRSRAAAAIAPALAPLPLAPPVPPSTRGAACRPQESSRRVPHDELRGRRRAARQSRARVWSSWAQPRRRRPSGATWNDAVSQNTAPPHQVIRRRGRAQPGLALNPDYDARTHKWLDDAQGGEGGEERWRRRRGGAGAEPVSRRGLHARAGPEQRRARLPSPRGSRWPWLGAWSEYKSAQMADWDVIEAE